MGIQAARFCGAALFLAVSLPAQAQTSFEDQVLEELNAVRRDPAAYVDSLTRYRGYYRANFIVVPGAQTVFITQEGTAPVDEAITYLRQQARRGQLQSAQPLAVAAADHCATQAADGSVGHAGPDGSNPGERVKRRGGGIYVSEVITYGAETPADVVRQLIIDDGVPDRSHRALLFAEQLRFAGVSCGAHPTYRMMCVVDFARTPDGRSIVQVAGVDRNVPARF